MSSLGPRYRIALVATSIIILVVVVAAVSGAWRIAVTATALLVALDIMVSLEARFRLSVGLSVLRDVQRTVNNVQSALAESEATHERARAAVFSIRSEVSELAARAEDLIRAEVRTALTASSATHEATRNAISSARREALEQTARLQKQVSSLDSQINALSVALAELSGDIKATRELNIEQRALTKDAIVDEFNERVDGLALEVAATRTALDDLTVLVGARGEASLVDSIAALQEDVKGARRLEGERHAKTRKLLTSGFGNNANSLRRRVAGDVMAIMALRDVPVDRRPVLRGWALLPEVLRQILELTETIPEGSRVLELGSGTSTAWIAGVVKRRDGRISFSSYEHSLSFHARTQRALIESSLSDYVHLKLVPLEEVQIDGMHFNWYADWNGARDVSLLVVDGPPGRLGTMARYPAVQLIEQRLVDGGFVVVDDMGRADEKLMVERWREKLSDFEFESMGAVEDAAVFRVTRSNA